VLAIEIKARSTLSGRDATPFTRARHHLGERLAGGLVVHRGQQVVALGEGAFAIPDWVLLGLGAEPRRPVARIVPDQSRMSSRSSSTAG
jgi:hypothetical protein